MSDESAERIRDALTTGAGPLRYDATLAERAIAEARGIRRRQALTAAIPLALTAVSVATVPGLVNQVVQPREEAAGPAATGTTSTPSAAASPSVTSEAPHVPWVSGSTLTANGRRVALPQGWAVLAVDSAGSAVVLDVAVNDSRFAVQVLPSGSLKTLRNLDPPFALSTDGTHLAGLAPVPDTPVDSAQPVPDLVVVDLGTEAVQWTTRPERPYFPEQFLGPGAGEVLVSQTDGPPRVWAPASGRLSPLDLPLSSTRMPIAVDPTGKLFVTVDAEGHVRAERRGTPEPVWSSTIVADRKGAFSPDGSAIAFSSGSSVTVIDASDGRERSRSTVRGGQRPWDVTWEDADTVLARDADAVQGSGVLRCTAGTGACSTLDLGPGAAGSGLPVLIARRPG